MLFKAGRGIFRSSNGLLCRLSTSSFLSRNFQTMNSTKHQFISFQLGTFNRISFRQRRLFATNNEKVEDNSSEKEEETNETESTEEEATGITITKKEYKDLKKLILDQETDIKDLQFKIEEFKKELGYSMADNANLIKRYKAEIEAARQYAIEKFAKDLLDVQDNMQRALTSIPPESMKTLQEEGELNALLNNLYTGIKLTSDGFSSTLKRFGVVEYIPEIGEKFDPNLHEAFYEYDDPNLEAKSIGQIANNGYKIGKRILRAPKVGLVKKKAQ